MFPENRWDGHVIDVKIDDESEQFVGIIRNIPDRCVRFSGHDYVELKNAYVKAVQNYTENPTSFPETSRDKRAIARFTRRSQFRDIFTSEQLEPLRGFRFNAGNSDESTHAHPRHSLHALIEAHERSGSYDESRTTVACNTERSLEMIQLTQPAFVDSIKNRLLDCSDYTQSSSALAELRAFGVLCTTGLRPEAINDPSEKSADFKMPVGQALLCLIEVHTRFSNPNDERQIPVEDIFGKQDGNVRIARISSITPFGQPDESKSDDGVSTNMISKICSMKQKEEQFIDDAINILWIDLQDTEVY